MRHLFNLKVEWGVFVSYHLNEFNMVTIQLSSINVNVKAIRFPQSMNMVMISGIDCVSIFSSMFQIILHDPSSGCQRDWEQKLLTLVLIILIFLIIPLFWLWFFIWTLHLLFNYFYFIMLSSHFLSYPPWFCHLCLSMELGRWNQNMFFN